MPACNSDIIWTSHDISLCNLNLNAFRNGDQFPDRTVCCISGGDHLSHVDSDSNPILHRKGDYISFEIEYFCPNRSLSGIADESGAPKVSISPGGHF